MQRAQAIKMDSSQGLYYQMRSQTYNALGNKAQALTDAQTAQQLGIQIDPSYLENLR